MRRLGLLVALAAVAAIVAPAVASADTITPLCTTAQGTSPCAAGWYRTPVLQLAWAWTPGGTPGNCNEAAYPGDAVATVSCTVTWTDGFVGTQSYTIKVETSSPTATVAPSRPPDSDGWFTHPVAGTPSASAFSGIASCATTTYAGPDTMSATVSASCVDNAGKTVAATSAPFAYDVTPPALIATASPADKRVALSWQTGGDLAPTVSVSVTRSSGAGQAPDAIYAGAANHYVDTHVRNGVQYTYTITAIDQAGHATVQPVVVTPGPRLLSPTQDAHLSAPPILTWTPVTGASYYNVQLYHNGKVLSTWPDRPSLQLRHRWRFDGHRHRLAPGRYRWFVWPGFGKRSAARYGHAIGSGTFVVVRRA
jgi:hypothetical protein